MIKKLSGLLLLFIASPAWAAGWLSCQAESKQVAIAIESGITTGLGSPLFDYKATLKINDSRVPEYLRKSSFDQAVQYWLYGNQLNLMSYRQSDGGKLNGTVQLTIMAHARHPNRDGSYDGTYTIDVTDDAIPLQQQGRPLTFKGSISCSVE